MRAFLIRILMMTSIFYALVLLLSSNDNGDKAWNTNENIERIKFAADFDSLDVLFIGNSYCYTGIIPKIIDESGLRSYNLGIATSGPAFYKIVLNDYLGTVSTPPKLICILVSPTTFSVKSDNFEAYPIHRYLHQPMRNETVVLDFHNFKEYPQMLTKSASKSIENTLHPRSQTTDSSMYFSRGYQLDTTTVSPHIVKDTRDLYTDLMSDHFDEEKFGDLVKYAKTLKNPNLKVVFFTLPTNDLKDYLSAEFLRNYIAKMEELGNEFRLIKLSLPLDSTNFRNIDHMNMKGATIVSEIMRDRLKNLLLLSEKSVYSDL